MCVWSLSDGNKELKITMPILVDAAGGKKSKLLATTVGRENICFIYLTRPFPQRYTLTMSIYIFLSSQF